MPSATERSPADSLSLWEEGRGEGLATKTKILLSPFLSEVDRKKDRGEFSFLVTQLHPHPSPLPKGEGVTYKILVR